MHLEDIVYPNSAARQQNLGFGDDLREVAAKQTPFPRKGRKDRGPEAAIQSFERRIRYGLAKTASLSSGSA
jgi:hypothetical protein